MSYPKLSGEEITKRGRELYEKSIRTLVETAENIGKIISINVETGEYKIGDDLIITSRKLQTKQADAPIWAGRIGFDAVYTIYSPILALHAAIF
ncbi:hypothetical protein [Anabaena catenula]|uniref:Uncharacterized protein n=1 Tax=Anabaena catenula FACHB-362 TaxID=2692877 RepID=A0ABR8JCW7_9NOST|nr:hypothetical protein [Anabaena catenula]MBD2694646.1 hypothetical protein [Anabaena catenula FACHB-362]